jgi:hypothetical protein
VVALRGSPNGLVYHGIQVLAAIVLVVFFLASYYLSGNSVASAVSAGLLRHFVVEFDTCRKIRRFECPKCRGRF